MDILSENELKAGYFVLGSAPSRPQFLLLILFYLLAIYSLLSSITFSVER